MPNDPMIENLLVLQERDVRLDGIRARLDEIPLNIAKFERGVAAAKAVLQGKLDEQKALELRRRDMENAMKQAEEKRDRFRTQQLSVKKNDEYAAMELQIEAAGKEIDDLETKAMEAMLALDEFEGVIRTQKETTAAEVAVIEGNIASVRRVEDSLKAELASAAQDMEQSKAAVSPDLLKTYLYVKTRVKRPPYVVPMEEGRCGGCHIKVPGEIVSQLKKGAVTRCDSCGRILYL